MLVRHFLRQSNPEISAPHPPHWPDDGAQQQQVQQENQRPVPAHVSVDEGQGQLGENGGDEHESDGEAHPDVILVSVVDVAEHGRGHELGAVEHGGQDDAEGGAAEAPAPAVVDHQHDAVFRLRVELRRIHVRDLSFLFFHCHFTHALTEIFGVLYHILVIPTAGRA